MTREEQIEREALLDYDAYADNNYHAFKLGVAWADENPNLYNDEKYHTVKVSCLDELNRKAALYDTFLEKACEYLKSLVYQEYAGGPLEHTFSDEDIKNFKKYLWE